MCDNILLFIGAVGVGYIVTDILKAYIRSR